MDISVMDKVGIVFFILFIIWYVIVIVQGILAYGTAYRATKRGGDTGVALFGWFIVYSLAAMVPGLGIYLWKKSFKPPVVEKERDAYITG